MFFRSYHRLKEKAENYKLIIKQQQQELRELRDLVNQIKLARTQLIMRGIKPKTLMLSPCNYMELQKYDEFHNARYMKIEKRYTITEFLGMVIEVNDKIAGWYLQ